MVNLNRYAKKICFLLVPIYDRWKSLVQEHATSLSILLMVSLLLLRTYGFSNESLRVHKVVSLLNSKKVARRSSCYSCRGKKA